MSDAYVVGYITVKNIEKWAEYRSQVPDTLAPWGAELVFRGNQVAVLAGENPHSDIVVIRFPDIAAVNGWCTSPAYQALIPLRRQAAEMVFSPMKHSSLTLRSRGAARITPRAAP
jgi:uncharacterized protein (DUF1330 family)